MSLVFVGEVSRSHPRMSCAGYAGSEIDNDQLGPSCSPILTQQFVGLLLAANFQSNTTSDKSMPYIEI
jgi:hypothetical protein